MFNVKGFRGITTFKKASKKRPNTLHELLSMLAMLEHERDRLIKEKMSWANKVEGINARLDEIEAEKRELNQPISGKRLILPSEIYGDENHGQLNKNEITLRY